MIKIDFPPSRGKENIVDSHYLRLLCSAKLL